MITNSTRNRACDFLLRVADQERHAEKHRQILCDNVSFEPYNAFRRMCGTSHNFLTVGDIQQFLADNRVFKNHSNIEKFVRHYCETSGSRLDYREFLRVVLPMSESEIRAQASQRPIYSDNYAKLLPSVEASLCDVLAYEVDFFDNLYLYFRDLSVRGDYSPADLYHEIKRGFESEINFHHLRQFFVHQGIVPFDHEVIEIIRRLDKDDDGTVSFRELQEFLSLVDSAFSPGLPFRETFGKETEVDTTITRSNGREEKETFSRTVTRDDFVRSPSRKSESYRSIRRSYGHRPSVERKVSREYTTVRTDAHHGSHRHIHRPLHTHCVDVCTGCHSYPCTTSCCHEDVVVECRVPRKSVTRTYHTHERVEPVKYSTVTRRSVSRDPRPEPVRESKTVIRRSISREREEPEVRTYRSVRKSYGRDRPAHETETTTTFVRRPSTDVLTDPLVYTSTYVTREPEHAKYSSTYVTRESRAEPEVRTYRSVRKSYDRDTPVGHVHETETTFERKSNRFIDRDPLVYTRTYVTRERSPEPVAYTTTYVTRERSPEPVEVSRTIVTTEREVEPVAKSRTTTTFVGRDREGDKYSRERNSFSQSRKYQEDIKYNEWANEKSGSPARTRGSTASVREIGGNNTTKSIRRTASFDLTVDFINYLRFAARLESELDKLKQELCLRTDYSPLDHFRCIDVDGRGFIREADLSLFLRDIDPTMNTQKIIDIFRRLDTDEDGSVSYSDFVDIILPLEPHYEHLVKGRVTRNQTNQFTFYELYSYRTRDCVKALFQLAAANEAQLASLRASILAYREPLFEQLDARSTGRVDSQQLLRYCERNGLPLSSSELELLLRRLDKNADAIITYNDFLKEMQA